MGLADVDDESLAVPITPLSVERLMSQNDDGGEQSTWFGEVRTGWLRSILAKRIGLEHEYSGSLV